MLSAECFGPGGAIITSPRLSRNILQHGPAFFLRKLIDEGQRPSIECGLISNPTGFDDAASTW